MQNFVQSATAAAVIAIASFGSATAAQATIYNVTSAGLYSHGTVQMTGTINGNPFDQQEYAGILRLDGVKDGTTPFSVFTYCFDILHGIGVGIGGQSTVNYTFSLQPVTTDLTGNAGAGNALGANQIERMSGLTNLGAWLYTSGASNLAARMSAIQAAIWSVEYGISASNFSAAGAQGYYNSYIARSFPGASTGVLVASNAQGQLIGNIQGLGIGTVPEPQSWALMIVGFGLVGVSARRRRRAKTVAA